MTQAEIAEAVRIVREEIIPCYLGPWRRTLEAVLAVLAQRDGDEPGVPRPSSWRPGPR
jgi:hypothetical protein